MINVIYGEKGTGKTKKIVDMANDAVINAKGIVVYLDQTNHRMHDLDRNIRLVEARHYGITSQCELIAFIKGMIATNYDIEQVYIDGVSKLLGCNIEELADFYAGLEQLSAEYNIDFTVTASCAKENLPAFVAKYVK